jgi:glycerophosphoryl diester phosphodiesterase
MIRIYNRLAKKLAGRGVLFILLLVCQSVSGQKGMNDKLIIAHRGASGYLPEHTLESKALAYGMGADYIEQDLVLTKDDVPLVLHDIYLDDVTNVSEVFPDRARKDGRYYTIDFTYDEVLQLKAHERIDRDTGESVYPDRFPLGLSSFSLHSLNAEIELIQGLNKSTGRQVGIYPEIKNPGFHKKEGKDISRIVLDILKEYGYSDKEDLCILQCFDRWELRRIRVELGSRLFLTQLLENRSELDELQAYAAYADAIGPWYGMLINGINLKGQLTFSDAVETAHQFGLQVHPYTYRKDDFKGFSSFEELLRVSFEDLDVDGVFTDFPDLVAEYLKR